MYLQTVDDRNPAKLLLAARDVMTGIMLPWHLSREHKARIDEMRKKLDEAVEAHVSDDKIRPLLLECVEHAEFITSDCIGVRNVHGKMDRARLTLHCILERAPWPSSDE